MRRRSLDTRSKPGPRKPVRTLGHFHSWVKNLSGNEPTRSLFRSNPPPRGRREWKFLVIRGMDGALQSFLNGIPSLGAAALEGPGLSERAMRDAIHRRLDAIQRRRASGVSLGFTLKREMIETIYESFGWPGLQYELILESRRAAEHPSSNVRNHWREAVAESILFANRRFVLRWCECGSHWFISDDKRRKDCLRHRIAGQQKRWRKNKEARARAVEAMKTRERLNAQ